MKILIFILSSYLIFTTAYSQVNLEWVKTYSEPINRNVGKIVRTDKLGNVYIAATSIGINSSLDYLTIKYTSNGDQIWTVRYNGTGNDRDELKSMIVDSSGNVYVTGYSKGLGSEDDFLTIKYDSSGLEKWVNRYNGPSNSIDYATDIAIDNFNNVYITGYSYGDSTAADCTLIKYDTSGIQQWIQKYTLPGINLEIPNSISINNLNDVFIAGYSSFSTHTDLLLLKYNSNGNLKWSVFYHDTTTNPTREYKANAICTDPIGNVYLTGMSKINSSSNEDFITLKYDSLGILKWIALYNGPSNSIDIGSDIQIDGIGNVLVAGRSYGANSDFLTIKYTNSGLKLWEARYNGTGNGFDIASEMILDSHGNTYIVGHSLESSSYNSVITIKYDTAGIVKWLKKYNRTLNNSDGGNSIALDPFGNILVTGTTNLSGVNNNVLTLKYSQDKIVINLKLLFEGMYYPVFNQLTRKDSISVYLCSSVSPYNKLDSIKGIIDSISFSGLFKFTSTHTGLYYLVVKHFNCIETWSKAGGEYLIDDGQTYTYDFTSSVSQAYGNNLKPKGTKYCIFSGDVNQSGFIDGSDQQLLDNDSYNYTTGLRLPSDLNGDNIVDASDLQIEENNSYLFVGVISP